MTSSIKTRPGLRFYGIRIYTAANRRSVMGIPQYRAYNRKFGVRGPIRPSPAKGLRGIGGSGIILGQARTQIPFNDLEIIIDVYFAVLKEVSTSLLSIRDRIENGVDISLQEKVLTRGSNKAST